MKIFNVHQIKEKSESQLQQEETEDKLYFNGIMSVLRIPEEIFYESCPSETCKKKVT